MLDIGNLYIQFRRMLRIPFGKNACSRFVVTTYKAACRAAAVLVVASVAVFAAYAAAFAVLILHQLARILHTLMCRVFLPSFGLT